MARRDMARRRSEAQRRNPGKTPRTIDYQNIDFDIFSALLSFYVRSVNLLVSQDLDHHTESLGLAGGTGKISTILLTDSNPGLRPSVIAHYIRKDRSAMAKLLWQMEHAGFLEQRISPAERRARELYLTKKGEAVAKRLRQVVKAQDDDFFAMLTKSERETLLGLLRKVYESYIETDSVSED
ncbi:MarR family winged helix-turn-helix transcriptional regulator [Dongia deserti]|uniref:MarR family winged helix-turn-helix transcriptional regulator n=1 Tax=Dongia deserti TaxID=2268030 RepID=UPI0013C43A5B|nr:MarR family transcriptional regulator [Dongia deserti]